MSRDQHWHITYEIHVWDDGRWTVFFSSPEAAEARGMLERLWDKAEITGLRLVKEIWDPATDRCSTLVLDERRRRRPRRAVVPQRIARVMALPEPVLGPPAGATAQGTVAVPPVAPSRPPVAALCSAAVGLALLAWGLLG